MTKKNRPAGKRGAMSFTSTNTPRARREANPSTIRRHVAALAELYGGKRDEERAD